MIEFLTRNLGNIIVVILLIIMLALAVRSIVAKRRTGKCSCGCSGCPSAGVCHAVRQSESPGGKKI